MTRNRLPQVPDERLDLLGRAVVRSHAEAGREAADAAVASPFLYARVRANVAERRRLAEADGGWLAALLPVARRAVPTMAFAAFVASAALLWFAWFGASTNGQFNNDVAGFVTDEVVFGAGGVESAVLSGGDGPSHDEILMMVVERGGREAQGR